MTDETLSHIKLEFNRNAAQIVEWLALSPETLRRAQLWLAQQQETPAAKELSGWLHKNGGQLDRADGPAIIVTHANGYRREAWYSQGQFDRADGPAIIETGADGYRREQWYSKGEVVKVASLAGIPGVTLYPAGPI